MKLNKKIQFTKQGYDTLVNEQKELLEKRKESVALLKVAREMGDLSENSAYRAAKFKLSSVDSRLRYLERVINNARIIETTPGIVCIGSRVVVQNDTETEEFYIVGDVEADTMNKKISQNSPIGKALMGKKIEEIVIVFTPNGKIEYTIKKIY